MEIRRYPVKAMAGESLRSAAFDGRGLVGDRWFACVDDDGKFASNKNSRRFRRHDPINDFAARVADDGVEVAGPRGSWTVGDPGLDADLSHALGAPVAVRAEADVSHYDSGSVSLIGTATLAWCEQRWGGPGDPRRFRANLLIETDEPFVEESWIGGPLTVGGVVLRPVAQIPRCRTIDLAQDGVAATPSPWLKPLGAERDLQLGVYADVATPGTVTVGDAVAPAS